MTEPALSSSSEGQGGEIRPEDHEESSVEFVARRDTILYQIRELFIGYADLEYLNRVVQQATILSDPKLVPIFKYHAERLYATLRRYNAAVELISPKNKEAMKKKYGRRWMDALEEIGMDLFVSAINDDDGTVLTAQEAAKRYRKNKVFGLTEAENERAYDRAGKFYEKALEMFDRKFHVEPDIEMAIAWFGFNLSLASGYRSAYECVRMLIQDYNSIYGYDFFHIDRSDYSKALADLRYENILGDQTTSIDAQAMLQLIVYGAWCNKGINEKRPGFDSYELTLRDVFQMAGIIDFLGYMKEYHRVKLELAWGIIHRRFIHPPKASFSSLEFADSGNVCKRPFRHWQNDRPEIT